MATIPDPVFDQLLEAVRVAGALAERGRAAAGSAVLRAQLDRAQAAAAGQPWGGEFVRLCADVLARYAEGYGDNRARHPEGEVS